MPVVFPKECYWKESPWNGSYWNVSKPWTIYNIETTLNYLILKDKTLTNEAKMFCPNAYKRHPKCAGQVSRKMLAMVCLF